MLVLFCKFSGSTVNIRLVYCLHSAVSALENGLAAPILILVQGKKALACLYIFKPITIALGGTKPQDAATALLQNSVRGELVLVKHLQVGRQALSVKWIPHERNHPNISKGVCRQCDRISEHNFFRQNWHFQKIGCWLGGCFYCFLQRRGFCAKNFNTDI